MGMDEIVSGPRKRTTRRIHSSSIKEEKHIRKIPEEKTKKLLKSKCKRV